MQTGTDVEQSSGDLASSELARRAFDLGVAGVSLVVFIPIMLVIALAILAETGSPLLYTQVRLGRHGRPFRIYKFRKFHKECGSSSLPLTLDGDPRLTMVGRALRFTKLDELPQFWNILRGDMSIVGPRPEVLEFADCFVGDTKQVLEHKPGILGPSQVAFRNECALYPPHGNVVRFYRAVLFPAKARLDLEYYCSRTLYSDVIWMFRGILAVVGWPGPELDFLLEPRSGVPRTDGSRID